MNFLKHKVSEREMLSEMMNYCQRVIDHRRKDDKNYFYISVCISTRTKGVQIENASDRTKPKIIIVIRYDERNNFYYFLEKMAIGKNTLENRIIIEDKKDFYTYFNDRVQKSFAENN